MKNMIVIFAICLATVVTNGEGKHIELISNEEFRDELTRRAEGGGHSNEVNHSKPINSNDSHTGDRYYRAYNPEIDLALAEIYVRGYKNSQGKKYLDDAGLIETPVHHSKEEEKANPENHTPDSETPIHNPEEEKPNQEINTADTEAPLSKSKEVLNVSPEVNPLEPEAPIRESESEHSDTEHITEENAAQPITETILHDESIAHVETHVESSSQVTESHIHDTGDNHLIDENTPEHAIDTSTHESADVFNELDSHTTENIAEINVATTENHSAVAESIPTNEDSVPIGETTSIPAVAAAIEEEPSSIKAHTKPKINTIISAVNEIEDGHQADRCSYCHKVYEILWPNRQRNQLLLRSQEPEKEPIRFVPVHQYLRNFAYQNSNKGLRLNKENAKAVKLNNRHNRQTINVLRDKPEVNEFNQFNYNWRKFAMYKKKDESPNISDDLIVRYETQAKNLERTKLGKGSHSGMPLDDTDNDILRELMNVRVGKEKTVVRNIDTYNKNLGDIDKYARLDNLFDFISAKDYMAFEDMEMRKMSNGASEMNVYMNILRELMLEDDNALEQYDWLATTVQIQSALMKILELINRMRQSEPINPADLQILKYIVFLHKFTLEVKEHHRLDNKLKKRLKLLPRHKRKRKDKLLKEKDFINRIWLYLRTLLPDMIENDELGDLYEFLINVQDGLFHLHEAIRYIADVTKFDRQNWYSNLKQLYLSADEKHLRELLLHISMARLVDLVEHSKQGLDNDVAQYLKTHKKGAIRIVKEMLFIGKIVDEIEINMN